MTFEQSVSWWCYERDDIDELDLIETIKQIGYPAVELVPEDKFQLVTDHGLKIVTHGLHRPLEQGWHIPNIGMIFNNKRRRIWS